VLPLYEQIYITLRNEILAGRFVAGGPLPPEKKLAARFEVSRVTIRRTLEKLEAEDLIDRRHGVGTFAKKDRDASAFSNSLSTFYSHLQDISETKTSKVLKFSWIDTPGFLKSADVDFGAKVLRISRLSRTKSKPVHLFQHYLPECCGRLIKRSDIGSQPLLLMLESHGLKLGETDMSITAAIADIEMADLLDVEVGAPLILCKRLSVDTDGNPVEFFESQTRPDLFEYRIRFGDVKSNGKTFWPEES
jgi:GntR family transcriptional regulator